MVGAMMGAAAARPHWWPIEWVDALRDCGARARDLGGRLHDVSTLRHPPDGFDIEDIKRGLGY